MMRREREAVRSRKNVFFFFTILPVILKEGRDIYESLSGRFKLSCSIVLYPLWRLCACLTQTVSQRVTPTKGMLPCVYGMFWKTATFGIQGEIHWKEGKKGSLKTETEKGHRDKPRGQFKGKKKKKRTSKIGGLNLSPSIGPRTS